MIQRQLHFILLHCFLLLLAFVIAPAAFGQDEPQPPVRPKKIKHQDDVIVLDNGDTLTGEIKRVEHGILHFKSDRAIGTLQIDWVRVRRVISTARYEFELLNGKLFIGTIIENSNKQTEEGYLTILRLDQSIIETKIQDIYTIREMQETFLGRLKLSVDAGISFTQGNKQTQWNAALRLEYFRPKYSLEFSAVSLFSSQTEAVDTSRHVFMILGKRIINKNWSYLALGNLLNDSQQDLQLRTIVGGGLQRMFYRSNRTRFAGIIGFVYVTEEYTGENRRNNGEILTGLAFDSYRFRSSEINAYILVYPSVTEAGSVRVDVSAYWKWEIISDLFWKLSFFDNFNSNPPTGAPTNNLGVNSSIGWSFN